MYIYVYTLIGVHIGVHICVHLYVPLSVQIGVHIGVPIDVVLKVCFKTGFCQLYLPSKISVLKVYAPTLLGSLVIVCGRFKQNTYKRKSVYYTRCMNCLM